MPDELTPTPGLSASVRAASRQPRTRAAVAEIYEQVGKRIAARNPLCVLSGRCCHFEDFGHRLYVTTLELALFVHEFNKTPPPARSDWNGHGCPFQVGKLCGVHAMRPFGCRMFFCDTTSTDWQNEQYEVFHSQIKKLHESLNVPYAYVEWRTALGQLGFT